MWKVARVHREREAGRMSEKTYSFFTGVPVLECGDYLRSDKLVDIDLYMKLLRKIEIFLRKQIFWG